MTTMATTFRRMLWPPYERLSVSDEFVAVAEGFRVRVGFTGNALELSFEGSGTYSTGSAQALAERYVRAVKWPVVLITEEEYRERTAPPFQGNMTTMMTPLFARREDPGRVIREARNEILASSDPALRRCYDYLQDAGERKEGAIFDLYKAVETIENALGGQEQAGRILGVAKEIDALKRAANEPTGDERHAPKDPASTPSPAALGRARENTMAVVHAYEAHLLASKE